jgi:hypothetical protein
MYTMAVAVVVHPGRKSMLELHRKWTTDLMNGGQYAPDVTKGRIRRGRLNNRNP